MEKFKMRTGSFGWIRWIRHHGKKFAKQLHFFVLIFPLVNARYTSHFNRIKLSSFIIISFFFHFRNHTLALTRRVFFCCLLWALYIYWNLFSLGHWFPVTIFEKMASLEQYVGKVRVPTASDRVVKDECVYTFETPVWDLCPIAKFNSFPI